MEQPKTSYLEEKDNVWRMYATLALADPLNSDLVDLLETEPIVASRLRDPKVVAAFRSIVEKRMARIRGQMPATSSPEVPPSSHPESPL